MKDVASYQELTGDSTIVQLEMLNPGMKPNIESRDSAVVMALNSAELIANNDAYHTQEGAKTGLNRIVGSVRI